MDYQVYKKDLLDLGLSLFSRGYATGGSGNMSLKLPDGNILATPTGSSFGRLVADELSVVDMSGNHLWGKKPSKEVAFHLSLYKGNQDCKAVVHLHSTYLTALSCLENLDKESVIKPFTPYYVMRIGQLPLMEYYPPGSPDIALVLAKLAPHHRAFLLKNHGPIVTGIDIFDAVDNAEELEETAKLTFLLQNSSIRYLSDTEIDKLISTQ